MNIFTLIFSCLLFAFVSCKHFRLGRSKGGNLGAPGDCHENELPPAQWFKQNLDHFSRTDQRIWKQRYYINDTFYSPKAKGPVFLMIGGEGPADPRWMVKGTWIDYAKVFGALCIMLEHRFYGESHPTSDMSVKNLAYLSSEQALADLANFISHMKDQLPEGSKWIVFGGSYPGSLAAWARLKYPHLVHGAVSSSGPLLAKVDFDKYFKVVVDALKEKTGSDDCVNKVIEAHKQIVKLFATNQAKIVEKSFRVCQPFAEASKDDMKNFFSSIADDFAGVVQYNEDNRISQDKKSQNITINTICDLLTQPGSQAAYEKLAKFNSIILDASNQSCLDYSYKSMIKDLRNASWSSGGGRQWMYQTCTEFGFYQTSSAEENVFGNYFPVDFFIQQCEDVFGKKFNKRYIYASARWTNTNYGALNVSSSNVVYVHGSVDPWHALGIIDDRTGDESIGVIYIKGTAHCANMYPSRKGDSNELQKARLQVAHYIQRWLRTPA